jgi:hypothetical protein
VAADADAARLRRYLLGRATDEEASAIEEAYFNDDETVDRIALAEDEMIEEYLEGALAADDRERFERVYLASPRHRDRVELIRRLMAIASRAASAAPAGAQPGPPPFIASSRRAILGALAAAAVVALAVAAFWARGGTSPPAATTAAGEPKGSTAPADRPAASQTRDREPRALPKTFAMSLSPIAVRSAGAAPSLVVPSDATTVALRLEGDDRAAAGAVPARAVVRTADGTSVWEGPAAAPDRANGGGAIIEIPADRLRVDDYVIVLFATRPGGGEVEQARYVLRVRAR